jgi:hypothetical protein
MCEHLGEGAADELPQILGVTSFRRAPRQRQLDEQHAHQVALLALLDAHASGRR